jgi:hypothetical protein
MFSEQHGSSSDDLEDDYKIMNWEGSGSFCGIFQGTISTVDSSADETDMLPIPQSLQGSRWLLTNLVFILRK